MESEREQERVIFMAKGGGDSVQAFLEAADSASDGNSLDGESQDAAVFDANSGSRALELSSALAQIAALESQNAKLRRDNDEAETEAAAAKLKCKKFEKRVSTLRKENEDFSVREQRLQQEVGELKKKLKVARNQEGEPSAIAAKQAKRLQDRRESLKQARKFKNEQNKAAKTELPVARKRVAVKKPETSFLERKRPRTFGMQSA